MSESDWLTYLATLPPHLAELARHIMERCASVIAGEQLRHVVTEERLEQRITALEQHNDASRRHSPD